MNPHLAVVARKRTSFTFAWLTDIHVGRVGSYGGNEATILGATYDHIAATWPDIDFVVASGDLTDHSTTAEFDDFIAIKAASPLGAKTWYILPGNHDEGEGLEASGGTADGPATFAEYDAAGFPRRWAFTHKGYKFIGFTSFICRNPDPQQGGFDLSATDLTHVETELASRGSNIPFIFGHAGLSSTLTNNISNPDQSAIFAAMADYNGYVYCHGHRHADFRRDLENSINHINGECVAYSIPNTTGAFQIVTVNGTNITFETYHRDSPWALQDTVTFSVQLPDFTVPTLSSATISTSGNTVTLAFSEAVEFGAGGNAGFVITPSGSAATLTYTSGSGTASLVYTASRAILQGETATLAYTQPGSGVEDPAHNDLATFSGVSVTNNSTNTGFNYYSAIFDGTNDWLSRGAALTGEADSKVFTANAWFKTAPGAGKFIMAAYNGAGGFTISVLAAVLIEGYSPASALVLRMGVATDYRDDAWHHIIISCDMADVAKRFVYIDDVDVTSATFYTNSLIEFTLPNWIIGARYDATNRWNGLLGPVSFELSYIDLSVSGNRLKYRTAGGKPADLIANGLTPIIYVNSEVPAYEVNLGSGGGFTENGTLVDGGADKP